MKLSYEIVSVVKYIVRFPLKDFLCKYEQRIVNNAYRISHFVYSYERQDESKMFGEHQLLFLPKATLRGTRKAEGVIALLATQRNGVKRRVKRERKKSRSAVDLSRIEFSD